MYDTNYVPNKNSGNIAALDSIRKPKTEITEVMYPEQYEQMMASAQPGMMDQNIPPVDPSAMPQAPIPGQPPQIMPGEQPNIPTRPGDVFTPGVGWKRYPPST